MQGESGRLMDAPGQEQQENDGARTAWRRQKSSTYLDLGSGRALGVRIWALSSL